MAQAELLFAALRAIEPLTDCPHCGYSLNGLPREHRCPECGFEYDANTLTVRGIVAVNRRELLLFPFLVALMCGANLLLAWMMMKNAPLAAVALGLIMVAVVAI